MSTAGAQHPAACRSASPLGFFDGNDASHEGLGDADSAEAIAEKPDVDILAMLWPAPTDATAAILMALAASPDPRRRQICELLQTFTSQQGHIYIYIYWSLVVSLTTLSLFLGTAICNLLMIASAFFGSLAFYASLLSIKISQAFSFTSFIPSPLMLLIYITKAFVSFANSLLSRSNYFEWF